VRSDVDLIVTGVVLVAAIVDAATTQPPPPPPPPPPELSDVPPVYPFDRDAARAALQSVKYLDCGTGGVADLTVTFKPDGRVREVIIDEGELDDHTATCVMKRFAAVRVDRFSGVPRALRVRIRLNEVVAM
jgi:hypothetical protein